MKLTSFARDGRVPLLSLIIAVLAPPASAAEDSFAGRRLPPERRNFVDAVTGVTVTALTTHPEPDGKIYQTHPSWSADGRFIALVSRRSGRAELYAIEEASGVIVQLTDDGAGGRAMLDRRSNRVVRFAGHRVSFIDIDAAFAASTQPAGHGSGAISRLVAEVPATIEPGDLPTLDADGERVYFTGQEADPPGRPRGVYCVNLVTGQVQRLADTPFLAGHLQANPLVPGLIMMCNADEDNAPGRIWLLDAGDSKSLRLLFREHENDWVTHEVWCGADRALFILWPHRNMGDRPHGIASIRPFDQDATLHAQARYWHLSVTPDQRFAVADTMEGSLFLVDLARGQDKLLTQGHMADPTKPHPHPSVSPDSRRVLFVSNHFGNADLMTIDLPPWDEVPPAGRNGTQRPRGIVSAKRDVEGEK